jgi:hypothetical protein
MSYFRIQIIAILLLSILLLSCSTARRIEPDQTNLQNRDQDLIGFLVFKIRKDSVRGKDVIELVSKTQSDGKIKGNSPASTDFEDYLTIEVFKQNKLINVTFIEHPLYKHVEYVDEQGNLSTKYIELDQAEFFVRLQMKGNSNKIRISETLKNAPKRELKTIIL